MGISIVYCSLKKKGKHNTLFQCVILKKRLSCLIQSNIQRNISITVHSRQQRTLLQKEPKETNMSVKAKC